MPEPLSAPRYAFLREILSRVRKDAGLTQTDMAERINVSQQVVSLIESGQRRIDVVEFHAWALATGQDPVQLYAEVSSQLSDETSGARSQ